MIRRLTILTILFTVPLGTDAQKWNVSPAIFYGTFKMSSMKDLQENMARWSSFPAKVVDDFPGNIGYSFQAGYSVSKRVEVGLRYQFTSTGGRVDYGDYSGEFGYDYLLRSNSLGIFTNVRLNNSTQWPICFSFAAGEVRTDLEIISYFRLFDNSSSESYSESSTNYFFNPAINFNRQLSEHFRMYVGAGYEFQIHGNLLGDDITAEWDGVRMSLGMNYVFGFKKKSAQL
jgi:hypothetical protein